MVIIDELSLPTPFCPSSIIAKPQVLYLKEIDYK